MAFSSARRDADATAPLIACRTAAPVTDLEHPEESAIVRLPAEMDIANAEDVGEQLRSAFTSGTAVVIADLTSRSSATRPGRASSCWLITTPMPATLRCAS